MLLLRGRTQEGGPQMSDSWHPSKDEVAHILEEMRPIIRDLAKRDEDVLKAERWRQDHAEV